MKVGESVDDYFGRTLIIANKMRIHGEKMDDVWETDEEAGIEDESNGEEFEANEEPGEIKPESDQNGGDTPNGENSPRE
ncbi:hypothetical protein F0562_000984 [Nyssa sinensis]|uniref:Uncharacterized protein n=1 Tax=Nyssa sinensis TaxID=561372 RepID=A0A5J5C5N7_9ASTE|nr:hypothetical protein F0562_000984 [Nyssa sinensis]